MDEYKGCIGIDLGTTYSCVAYWNDDHVEIIPNNETGRHTTPSWVAFTDSEILVGDPAKRQAGINLRNTIYDNKRIIGKRYTDDDLQNDLENFYFNIVPDLHNKPLIKVDYKGKEKKLSPEQISALVLGKMRSIAEHKLGKRVKKAVITVPAYFNDSQRTATKNAAMIAGLECMKIVNEPTAACLCYGLDKNEDNTKVLIFDLGGGTFDVSVLNLCGGIFEVLGTCGNTHLGGEDFDLKLSEFLLDTFMRKNPSCGDIVNSKKALRKIKVASEAAKRELSTSRETLIDIEGLFDGIDFFYKLTRSKFESVCEQVFQKCMEPVREVLSQTGLRSDDISELVLVGGSTRIPRIREILSQEFNGKTLNMSVHPDEAVAYGAAVQGAISSKQDKSGKTKELLLLDVIPLSLGIEAKDGVMSKIIERGSQVPTKKKKMYTTVEDRQSSVEIQIYEGEREFTKDNHKIADFELTNLPKQARGVPKIEVIFQIDGNGILSVKAVDKDSGTSNDIVIKDTTRLTQDEINKMIDEAEEFRADDELRKAALNSRHIFEKFLTDVQRSINDPELTVDDTGNQILTPEEVDYMNQCILNNLTWLEDDENLDKTRIEQAKQQFEHGTKPQMFKLFARKKQLDMKDKHIKSDKEETDVNKISKHAHEMLGEIANFEIPEQKAEKSVPKVSVKKKTSPVLTKK